MDFRTFSSDALSWMKSVCSELFNEVLFSSSDEFDLLIDDNLSGSVVGFRITGYTICMADFVSLSNICQKNGCYYVVRSCDVPFCFYVDFYLENA